MKNSTAGLTIRSKSCTIEGALAKMWLRKVTSYTVENISDIQTHTTTKWDGVIYPVSMNGEFSTGYLEEFYLLLRAEGCSIEVSYTDKPLSINLHPPTSYGKYTLREYQLEALKSILSHEVQGVPYMRGIINAATNAGKSLIIAALMQNFNGYGLILIHNRLIFKQIVDLFKELGVTIGEIRHDKFSVGKITIAMAKTFFNRYNSTQLVQEYAHKVELLVVDEVHRSSAANYQKILTELPCMGRIGFSGTSLEGTEKQRHSIIQQFGSVITDISNQEMIDNGVSAAVTVEIFPIAYSKWASFDNHATLTRAMYSNLERLEIIHKVLSTYQRNILIYVDKTEHGETLLYWLKEKGFNLKFIHGEHSLEERLGVIGEFEKGLIDGLIATSVIKEGANIADIRTLVFAAAGKSSITVKQVVGRGLRKKEFNNTLTIIDFYDKCKNFEAQSNARIEIYRKEGFKIERV